MYFLEIFYLLGTEEEFIQKANGEDPVVWAKKYIPRKWYSIQVKY